MEKRLYRSRLDCKIAGVCGGLGEYFNIDPTFIRIIMVLLAFADGFGILAYIIAWIAMAKRPLGTEERAPATAEKNTQWNMLLPGLILIAIGVLFLMKNVYWWFDFWDFFWPAILIVVGLLLIFGRGRTRQISDDPAREVEEVK